MTLSRPHTLAGITALAVGVLTGVARSLPGLRAFDFADPPAPALAFGTLTSGVLLLFHARDVWPQARFRALLPLGTLLALAPVGYFGGVVAGTFIRDRLFWHYAPSYEALSERGVDEGSRSGSLILDSLPFLAQFCCILAPTYHPDEPTEAGPIVVDFQVAPRQAYRYGPTGQSGAGHTDYFGDQPLTDSTPGAANRRVALPPDVGLGAGCRPEGLPVGWCRLD